MQGHGRPPRAPTGSRGEQHASTLNLHVVAFDGLRGIAALAVLFYHSEFGSRFGMFTQGWLAVDFFFCLSGYVMGLAYDKRIRAGMTAWSFAKVRFFRLYPMMLVGAVIGIVLTPINPWARDCLAGHGERFFAGMASQLTLVPMWVGPCVFTFNNPYWSLFFELIASAVHFAILWRLSDRERGLYLAVLFVILSACGAGIGWINFGAWPEGFWLALPRCLFSYGIGYSLFRTRDCWVHRVPAVPLSLIAFVLFTLLSVPPLGGKLPLTGSMRYVAVAEQMALISAVFPLIIMMAAASKANGRWPYWLGATSYPLYTIHAPLVLPLITFANRLAPLTSTIVTLAGIAAIVALGWLLAVAVDVPLNRRRGRDAATRCAQASL